MRDSLTLLQSTPPEDELDHLLRAYFRSQVPAVWPPAPVLERSTLSSSPPGLANMPSQPRPPSDTLRRPHYVLAVSAVVLLAFGWFLIERNAATVLRVPSSTSDGAGTPMLPQTEASNPSVIQHLRKFSPSVTTPSPASQPADKPDTKRPPIKLP